MKCIKCGQRPKQVRGMCRSCFLADRPWPEQYDEMHAIGRPNWEIAKAMRQDPATFGRMADRYGRKLDSVMTQIVRDSRLAKGWTS
ncbi:Uncharacterised protein [Mycobacteroides abscessus subsp. abscessus]|uniref:hypothetical protein n=2 Tax=Mycobacteroides abscessus TaxID=36809 RepID=UPI0009A6172D|nr:hypothetical protein [Mycobacteroides abscessus]SLE90537.1 Uncharacterised protein [Mycobacteroides abscessus subsp. abscessus]SLF08178.1 Uncharacterised protein [Mycobacteroides abscessus subsp. abscessus]SLF68574.1 Uncharacterised protein [Mycobacteroides abscessus subsp. abscessus]SLG86163.1 Uncharacterised protein [Mycobacteroides abscessus subsp. abscessus]